MSRKSVVGCRWLWRWRVPGCATGRRREDVLEALRRGDLEFLDHPYNSVFKSLRMSIAALPADVADRYGELAVFPKDTSIPVTTIDRLWAYSGRLSPQRSRALLAELARKGLLSLVQPAGKKRSTSTTCSRIS